MPTPVYGSQTFTNIPDVNGTPVMLNGGGTGTISVGTSLPAASTAGNLYVDTTNDILWRDTGAAWLAMSRIVNVYSTPIAITSSASAIAINNTALTSTSGLQIATQTITPVSSTSQFILKPNVSLSSSLAATCTMLALQGTTVLGTSYSYNAAAGIATNTMTILVSPATTSPITFSLRAGASAGTMWVNAGSGATTLHGSAGANNRFLILEIQP